MKSWTKFEFSENKLFVFRHKVSFWGEKNNNKAIKNFYDVTKNYLVIIVASVSSDVKVFL